MKWALYAAALLLVGACGLPQYDPAYDAPPEAALIRCCETPERYPGWYVAMAERLSPVTAGAKGTQESRPGLLLAHPEALAHVEGALRPLDLLVVRNMGRKAGRIIPGHFTHAAIYLGDEAQLQRAGVWSDPRAAAHRGAVAGGLTFIESQIEGVHLSPADDILNTDAVAVLRPVLTERQRRAALVTLLSYVGRPFDTHFDGRTQDAVSCTELVQAALPGLELPVREVYGRPLVLPDDIAAQAVRDPGLGLVTYVIPDGPAGWRVAGQGELIRDLNRFWADPPRGVPVARRVQDCVFAEG